MTDTTTTAAPASTAYAPVAVDGTALTGALKSSVAGYLGTYKGDARACFDRARLAFRSVTAGEGDMSQAEYAALVSFNRARSADPTGTPESWAAEAAKGTARVTGGSIGHYVAAWRTVIDAGIVPAGQHEAVYQAYRVTSMGGTAAARQALTAHTATLPVEDRAAYFAAQVPIVLRELRGKRADKPSAADPLATTDADRIDGEAATVTAPDALLTLTDVEAFLARVVGQPWLDADAAVLVTALTSASSQVRPVTPTLTGKRTRAAAVVATA
jgi:hypothetical protein